MKNRNLISISGKMGSGKDTVGAIIQMLIGKLHYRNVWSREALITKFNPTIVQYREDYSNYQVRKFADKLKDMVCILLNCTREQLEDREFKEKELGEEWKCFEIYNSETHNTIKITSTKNEAIDFIENNHKFHFYQIRERTLTPRLLLQLLGTEAARDIIHPNIWVNALLQNYVQLCDMHREGNRKKCICYRRSDDSTLCETEKPNWIITDTRYPNEIDAISKLGGVKIKVINPRIEEDSMHLSETALDNYEDWDYVIVNDGTLEDLENKVKDILKDMGHEI